MTDCNDGWCPGVTLDPTPDLSSASIEGNVVVDGWPVCDHWWDGLDASVVCRELGFITGIPKLESHYGSHLGADFAMDDVECTGTEDSLLDCPHVTKPYWCTGDAGVMCTQGNT